MTFGFAIHLTVQVVALDLLNYINLSIMFCFIAEYLNG